MGKNSVVCVKKVISVTDLSGEKVMIDFNSGKYFLLKGVANDIWEMIQESIRVDDIIRNLLNGYDVSERECEESVFEFLNMLDQYELIMCR